MTHHPVLHVVSKLLIPAILLFALYVQFHGDFGPGGGFQAGVIFAAGIILYGLIHGVAATRAVLPPLLFRTLTALGVLLFAGVGIAAIGLGGNFLDYDALAHERLHGQHRGILLIELGVGVTVASVMVVVFLAFAGRRLEGGDEEVEGE
ncbi:MAG: Na(+)/H(+) antiporter subunit B [Gammaproteobacteria bacterium]|nr:Na(+)/H(+) antiporter subunit B [Gammaproteobacteria bacterium]